MAENLLDVRLKEIGGNFVFLKMAVDVGDALFRVFLEEILLIFESLKVVENLHACDSASPS